MKKEEATKIIIDCAKMYHENLENNNLLFIFGLPQMPEYFETLFLPRHFLHLTGVMIPANHFISSTDFYDRCLKSRLSLSDFCIPKDGTMDMKLSVLPRLIMIHKTAKMVGNYYGSKSLLYTERLAGNISACMGFVRDSNNYYIPNTALREDIHNVSERPQKRILAIYRKPSHESLYHELCYTAKGIIPSELSLPEYIRAKLCSESFTPAAPPSPAPPGTCGDSRV